MSFPTFDDAVDAHLRDCERRGLRPATLRYYRMVLGRFAALCAPMTPGDLSLASVRALQDRSPQLSPGSVRGFLRALRSFSRWLTDEGVLPTDPLARLRMPRVDTRPRVMPTDQELAAMLRTVQPTAGDRADDVVPQRPRIHLTQRTVVGVVGTRAARSPV